MGSEQKSQTKLSTQDLFGDILGEVESAWESHGRRSVASSAERSESSESATNGYSRLNPANESSESETAKLPDPPVSEPAASAAQDGERAASEPSGSEPASAATESAQTKPSAMPFSAPETRQELPPNGQAAATTPMSKLHQEDPDPQPDVAPPAGRPGAGSEASGGEASPTDSQEVRLSDSAGPEPAGAQMPRSTPDVASLLEPEDVEAEGDSGEAADEAPAQDLVGTGYLPWLEEKRATNWARLAAMAAVVAVAGLAVWWFALRPADAGSDPIQPSAGLTEPQAQPSESFIAELEQDAQGEGEVIEAVTAQDEIAAVVEPPQETQPPVEQTTQPPATQGAERATDQVATRPVNQAPQQAGPTVAELEVMIAGQLAAQERRLRQQLEEQRRQLEEEIARLEAANADRAQTPVTDAEPAAGEAASEAGAATAAGADGEVAPAGTAE